MGLKGRALSNFFTVVATFFVWAAICPPALGVNQETCKEVDLRPELGPIRNQGNIGWCYANGAADLAGFIYSKELKGVQVSAIDIAVAFNHFYRNSDIGEGGMGFMAVDLTALSGLCPRWVEDKILGPDHPNLKYRLNSIRNLKALYDSGDLNKVRQQVAEIQSRYQDFSETELWNVFKNSTKKNFPWHFAQAMCSRHRFKPPLHTPVVAEPKILSVLPRIHEQLNKNEPVLLGFHAQFLNNAPEDGRHLSVIAGRRWNSITQQCDLLLRNSWGSNCKVYAPKKWGKRCEKGNLWIPEDEVDSHAYGVTFLPF